MERAREGGGRMLEGARTTERAYLLELGSCDVRWASQLAVKVVCAAREGGRHPPHCTPAVLEHPSMLCRTAAGRVVTVAGR